MSREGGRVPGGTESSATSRGLAAEELMFNKEWDSVSKPAIKKVNNLNGRGRWLCYFAFDVLIDILINLLI